MSSLSSIEHIWSTITEIDTHAIRQQAETPFRVAIVGSDDDAVHRLNDALRTDPATQTPQALPQTLWIYLLPADTDVARSAPSLDLALIVHSVDQVDLEVERSALAAIRAQNAHLPVLRVRLVEDMQEGDDGAGWIDVPAATVDLTLDDPFADELVPKLLAFFPEQHAALGYHLPGLRHAICRALISETSIANAGYSASTGIAELVPILTIPMNVADMFVLSKNQALLSYKLAICLGNDIGIQQMAAELVGIVGTGFIWRELARTAVGLVPGIGIIPKIAISYAGTYVIGEAVYYWYGYGKKLTPDQMKALFTNAMTEGRARAAELVGSQRGRIRLPALPRPQMRRPALPRPKLGRPSLRRQVRRCPNCQSKLNKDIYFCGNCGFNLADIPSLAAPVIEDPYAEPEVIVEDSIPDQDEPTISP